MLVVDEVDDTRTTLQFCVEELIRLNEPAAIAVCVVHNKLKPKKGVLPDHVEYIAGREVPDVWNAYPWDAEAYGNTIVEHEVRAAACHSNINARVAELVQAVDSERAMRHKVEEELNEARRQLSALKSNANGTDIVGSVAPVP